MSCGVIFDWDGVVIDSSSLHAKSWDLLAEEENRMLPEGHFKQGFGRKNAVIIPEILGWTQDPAEIARISARKEALYRELIDKEGLEALPGVRDLLNALREAGLPCCIGSSTDRANIDLALKVLGFEGYFDGIISAGDVTQGKPHPDVFLKAAACIRKEPQSCLVFEDAHVGIEAAQAAKMKVIAVATTHPKDTLVGADRVVDTLAQVTVGDIESLFNQVFAS
ncbi:MAG: beta-phosphoglucomutase family hydrolase [Opitutales bacterium]|tara:strand:+ start:772 stop:1440 length:669 start_codon:yes stop_codon:yes gene_type:complete